MSGDVQRPGNYEVELGIPARDIVYGLAGGPPAGRRVKAWFPGGSSAPVLTEEHLDLPVRLRAHGRGRLDAGLGRDHRDRRLGPDRARRPAAGRVLPPRVVRQMRALPRGHQLDREDAGAHRPRRGDPDGPRRDGGRAGQHHRQLPLPAGRLDGDAGRVDDQALPARVRGAYGRPPVASRRAGRGTGRRSRARRRRTRPPDARRATGSRSRSTGARCARPRASGCSTPPSAATSRSRTSVTRRSSGRPSARAACAWSRSRASRSSRPPARPRSRTGWSSTPRPTA